MLRRAHISVVVLLAASGAAGCEEAFYPPQQPEAQLPAQPPPPREPETCAAWKPTGPADTPSAGELQAAIGKLEGSPDLERLMIRLGMSEVQRDDGNTLHTYRERGIQLWFRKGPSGERLTRVELFGRAENAKGYAGALPDKLSFAQTEDEVIGVMGAPEGRFCWLNGCEYQERGLVLHGSGRSCLSSIELVAPMAQNQVRYEDLTVQENAVEEGAHGIAISFVRTTPRVKGYGFSHTTVCLEDARGVTLKRPRWARSKYDEDDRQCELARSSNGFSSTSREVAFFPYGTLEQAPGPFTLKARLSTVLAAPVSAKLPEIALEPTSEKSIESQVTMPELKRARVAVTRAEVEKGTVYDHVNEGRIAAAIATGGASLLVPIPQRWERPDLQWSVYAGGRRAYKSSALQDVYSATWGASSSAFPLAPGDQFTICLEDEDGGDTADTIHCFDFTLESYMEQVKSGKPLAGGDVKKLVLGPASVSK